MTTRTAHGPVLVLSDPTYGYTLRPARLRERVQAYLRADSLDSLLARGVPPEADPMLFLHARRLASTRTRRQLARSVRRVLVLPEHPTRHPNTPRLARDRVRSAHDQLTQLADLLDSDRPVQTRGIALTRVLLVDGCGPLYRGETATDLDLSLREILAALVD